jgi:ketosteroid isomerase-like protein
MPEESEKHQTIRRIYEAFGRRDLDQIVEELDDDAQVDFTKSLGPEPGVYPGGEGIEKLMTLYWEAFEDISIEPEGFVDGPDGIVALVVARGRGRSSGASVEARGPHLWTFRDGKPIRFTLYQDKVQALEAAGLSE